ncbi:peptide deformylase [Enterobacterales bacterium endosymbiont of Anomoneura mori]|uniref:peptide deformylase n=1 Tax=Enterobacterales bacterium endosymbiont of Anomoneura mori TaxID=3132096 RepID=UPI00399C5B62
MSLIKLIYYPNKILKKKSNSINKIDYKIKNIIHNMFKIMYKKNGIGLAAPQIGINKRFFIVHNFKNINKKLIFINPKILKKKGKIYFKEGCLSIPKKFFVIKRYSYVKILAMNIKGNYFEFETNDILSICIQHEIDHLNGKLIIDYS